MQLPYAEEARVPKAKITEFLLDPEHEYAGPRAAFFIERGFRVSEWEALADALLEHAGRYPATETGRTQYGTKYQVVGPLRLPSGTYTTKDVLSAWIVPTGEETARLTSAYPLTP